ncbi:GPI mannosyltransferase 4-like [Ptychodera flava]|uniref:GPI mannosyltransferase 4-like n=1 Tax=Ptychodera flava TaxID=63121 RepID=UPI003969FD02
MDTLWIVLVVIRVLWTLLPQTGFVYPDEFFQNPEVMAGSIFGFDVYIPWEFNDQLPCRNVIFPFLTSGIPFLILKTMRLFIPSIVTTYTLMVFPRLFMLSLSFIIDYCVYKSCRALNLNPKPTLVVLASSFVTLVFHCRTFSNTIESILFALLLTVVIHVHGRFARDGNCTSAKDTPDEDVLSKVKQATSAVAVITTFGFFNRPTFLLFALCPISYLVYVICQRSSAVNVASLLPAAIATIFSASLCILADSLYYESDLLFVLSYGVYDFSFGDILRDIIITPFNFIAYNADNTNLIEQGIHSYYTHILFNIPILFLPLIVNLVSNLLHSDRHGIFFRKIDAIVIFLVLSVAVPVVLLSVFPHQETRFLIPLLVALSLLFAKVNQKLSKAFKVAWLLWNLIGCFSFGVLHEGGVVQSVDHIRSMMMNNNNVTMYDFVFYHTYTPPKHLFAYDPYGTNQNTRQGHVMGQSANQISRNPLMTIHSLPSVEYPHLRQTINRLVSQHLPEDKYALYVVAPSTLHHLFCMQNSKYKFNIQNKFNLHFPFSDFPGLKANVSCEGKQEEHNLVTFFTQNVSLNLYKIDLL